MAAIFTLRKGVTNASPSLVEAELYLHQGSGSIQFGSGSNTHTLLPLNAPAYGNINLVGSISASGDVRIGGNIYLGDNLANDTININSPFSGSIIPSGSNVFDLGSTANVYRNVYANNISASVITGSFSGTFGGINLTEFSQSVDNRLDLIDIQIDNLESTSASVNISIEYLNQHTESLNSWTGSTFNTFSQSVDNRLDTLENTSTSDDARLDALEEYSASLKSAISASGQDLIIYGNLTVQGTQTTLNTSEVTIEDKTLTLASGSTNSADANGAGIHIAGADVTMSWSDGNQRVELNKNLGVDGSISSSTLIGIGNVTIYSASVDSRLNIVEASASLYFDFSQSVDNRLDLLESTASYLNGDFSTSVDSRFNFIEIHTSSVSTSVGLLELTASFLNGQFSTSVDQRLDALEMTSGALNSYTQSNDVKWINLQNVTESLNQFTASATQSIVELFSSASTLDDRLDYLEGIALGGLDLNAQFTEIGIVTGSLILSASFVSQSVWHVHQFTQSANISIENLNSFTSSISTTIKDKLNTDGVISGSSQIQLGSVSGEITLGTQTTGSYVATITGDPTKGLTVAGSGDENAPVSITLNQNLSETGSVRFNSIGVNMTAPVTPGRIEAADDIIAFASSDSRLKKNITPIQNALEKVETIGGYNFEWDVEMKSVHGYEGGDIGVIAQEIEKIAPELVTTRENGYKAVKYEKIVPILIQAIKELSQKVKDLEKN